MPSSSASSRSSTPEVVDTVQIFVKTITGDSMPNLPQDCSSRHPPLTYLLAIPLRVPENTSIQNLTTLLSIHTSLPERDLRLVHAGKHLSSTPTATLQECHISRDSTLHLALPLRGGMPPKKLRCTHGDCKETAQRIVGDCGFCNGHYCGKHRLLEDHKCSGLEDVSTPDLSSDDSMPTVQLEHYGENRVQWWLVGLDRELLADCMH
jgi:hypothetical protein